MTIQTLEVRFPSLPIGEPVVLYSGDLTLSWDSQSLTGNGEIRLDWRPYPRISFRVDCPPEFESLHINSTAEVAIEMTGGAGKGRCRVWGRDFEGTPHSGVFFGSLEGEFLVGNPAPTEMVRFHVPNFPNYLGAATMMGSEVLSSRLSVQSDPWQVDLDAVPESIDVYTSIQKMADSELLTLAPLQGLTTRQWILKTLRRSSKLFIGGFRL